MSNKISENIETGLSFNMTDIGGTNSAGSDDTVQWVGLQDFDRVLFYVEVGTWNVADILDTLKLEQATSSAGAGKKDISGKSITTTAVAVGQNYILECKAADLDTANDYTHVRVYCAETGNTGPDYVTAWYIKDGARYPQADLTSSTDSV